MDNLAHSLLATALAKTPLGKRSPLAMPSMVVAANLPDADGAARFLGGTDAFFAYHRGLSHSVLGVAVEAVALTGLVRWAERRWFPGRTSRPFLPIAIGLASHPLLDSLNTYGIRPWMPFDDRWVYGDLAFIVDPWLWLIFGAATALAGARTRLGSLLLALTGAFMTWVMVASGRAPAAVQVAWLAGLALVAFARARGVGREQPERVVGAAFVLAAVYLAGLAVLGGEATRRGAALLRPLVGADERIASTVRSPWPADPLKWTVILETDRNVYRRTIDLAGESGEVERVARDLDLAPVRAALETPAGRAWRSFARLPIARVEESPQAVVVRLLDARYGVDRAADWHARVITLPAPPR